MFAGPSGTGKSLAAEVIAAAVSLDLYRIDLSQVVSKWLGETEKHLAEVFDAAEAGGAVLLFDEADALFGKRSEVRDSHYRYANIEVSFLLQRLEAFRGLAVLTTNSEQALDGAFVRRLRCIVRFPQPDATHRAAIWKRAHRSLYRRRGGRTVAHGAFAAGRGDRMRQAEPSVERSRDGGLGMRIIVHIDELALHGFAPAGRHAIADAVQRSLTELLATTSPAQLAALRPADVLSAPTSRQYAGRDATGRAIAGAVHAALTQVRS